VQLDGREKRTISFDPAKLQTFDHGYAMTSHSLQGLTAGRVIANIDTDSARELINTRLTYVAVSRAADDLRIYTNNAEALGARFATENNKTSAVDFRPISSAEQLRAAVELLRMNETAKGVELFSAAGKDSGVRRPESSGSPPSSQSTRHSPAAPLSLSPTEPSDRSYMCSSGPS